nr:hypothetical protein [Tern adenovirus]
MEILIKILLYLPSKSIAALCVAVPKWENFIRSPYFIKKHLQRFSKLCDNIYLCIILKRMEENNYKTIQGPCEDCILDASKTSSNHCINCLLQPHLLCLPIDIAKCACIDHLFLWNSIDTILWGKRKSSGLNNVWPQCSESIVSDEEVSRKRAKLSKMNLRAKCVFDF